MSLVSLYNRNHNAHTALNMHLIKLLVVLVASKEVNQRATNFYTPRRVLIR